MLLTPTSPPPKVRRSRGRSPPKVWVLPIDISRSNGITESIELLLLRESQFSHHTQDNGDVLYEGEYSTFSIDSYFGAREYRHKGGFTLQKIGQKVYTVLASHCLDHMSYEFQLSKGNRTYQEPFILHNPLERILNHAHSPKIYEPIQIIDPRFLEEAKYPAISRKGASRDKDELIDSVESFFAANKNHPLLHDLGTEYAHAHFHPIVKGDVPQPISQKVLPRTIYFFGYVERDFPSEI